ncbi:MAG: ornithine cyclodeaminase family protein [Halobacteriales archaeon]
MEGPLYLSSEDVRDLATPVDFVDAVRSAYRQRGRGAPANPRYRLTRAEPPGMLTGYAAILPETGVMGGYMYAAGFGEEDVWFATPLFDAETGRPLAIIDGAWMNPYKTGATGAIGVDALAREDASVLGLLGSGTQAVGQLRATATVRDLEEVRVYSPTPSSREAFAESFDARLDASVRAVPDAASAVSGADIVVTATTSPEPVFDGADLEPGTHVTAMGQYHPDRREVDVTTVARSRYVIDLRDRLDRDAGAYRHALEVGAIGPDHLHAELGEVVAGARPGRTDDAQLTLFDSGGTGIETTAGANLLYERAREDGLGVELQWFGGDDVMTGW